MKSSDNCCAEPGSGPDCNCNCNWWIVVPFYFQMTFLCVLFVREITIVYAFIHLLLSVNDLVCTIDALKDVQHIIKTTTLDAVFHPCPLHAATLLLVATVISSACASYLSLFVRTTVMTKLVDPPLVNTSLPSPRRERERHCPGHTTRRSRVRLVPQQKQPLHSASKRCWLGEIRKTNPSLEFYF